MSLISSKFFKSLTAVLCLSMIFWSSVNAQSLVLCISDNGHAEIESTLDSCCGQQPIITNNEVNIQALDSNACGNCTDTLLSFYFHQSSSSHNFELPVISNQAPLPTLPTDLGFTYNSKTGNYSIAGLVFHSHLDIQKITVLRV